MWGLFVRKHAEAVSQFHNVSVLYLHSEDELQEDEWVEDKSGNIYTLYIYYSKPKNKIAYFAKFLKLYLKGVKYLSHNVGSINLIHVHILTRMGFLALVSYYSRSLPFVITEHWSRYLPTVKVYTGWLRKRLTELVISKSKAIMPVTTNLKKAMESEGLRHKNYRIVPNVVDDIFFQPDDNTKNTVEKRIIHVSTFEDRSKNISGIIDAINNVKNMRSDFKMVFVGDGMDFNKIQEKVTKFNLEDRIKFTGLLEKEALVSEFERASFLLINSNYENMPVVINEAFATGLPVLSTNVGGISEHLTSDRGVLIEPGKPTQLVEQINWMLDHYKDFDSSEIRNYAKEHFSMSAVGKQISDVYQKVLSDK